MDITDGLGQEWLSWDIGLFDKFMNIFSAIRSNGYRSWTNQQA